MSRIYERSWESVLSSEMESEYFINLMNFIDQERIQKKIYPDKFSMFKAYESTPTYKVSVVILGQDPYHNGLADGLAFSCKQFNPISSSLNNIYKAINVDLGFKNYENSLSYWTMQGVFLLNTILTVEEGKPLSHKNIGWEKFTNKTISILNSSNQAIVWMLWGKEAQSKASLITNKKHLILKSSHPSPLSVHKGFLWDKQFSKANQYLIKNKRDPIDWRTF